MPELEENKRRRCLVFWLACFLFGLDIIFLLVDILVGQGDSHALQEMFSLSSEGNVPTWWASLEWFLVGACAFLSFFVDWKLPARKRFSWIWLVIALAFLIASADEVAQIHETVGSFLRARVDASSDLCRLVPQGPKDSPWIVFYALPLAGFGLSAITFLYRRLAYRRSLIVFCILAAECYGLAIALDWFQGCTPLVQRQFAEACGIIDPEGLVAATMTLEETLENVGTSFLVLSFASFLFDHVSVSLRDD